MKIFLSWSGSNARAVAIGLRTLLQDINYKIQPWMSETDIAAGTRWGIRFVVAHFAAPTTARPAVSDWLHGVAEWQRPETFIAWRQEVALVTGTLLAQHPPDDLLDVFPLKPHELLRDWSDRVLSHLKALSERHPDAPV